MLALLKTWGRRRWIWAGIAAAASVIVPFAIWFGSLQLSLPEAPTPARGQTTAVLTQEKRKVYPYSIVPGGARTVEEARKAMSDPAVRAHYAAFNLKNLKQVTLKSHIPGYLS